MANRGLFLIKMFAVQIQVHPVACDGLALRATWSRLKLQQITNKAQNFNVHVSEKTLLERLKK